MTADRVAAHLTLLEYAAGEATFENDDRDVTLALPLRAWNEIGRPEKVRIFVEAWS